MKRKPGHIYLVMTCAPHTDGEFVELEDHEGRSVNGTWYLDDKLWVLEIPPARIPPIGRDATGR